MALSRYLTNKDYLIIQDSQINQIVQKNQSRLLAMERTAIEEATSYLVQRFDTNSEFSNTAPWDPATIYYPGDRVVIDYSTFNPNISYPQGSCVIYNGVGYVANYNVVVHSPSGFISADWTSIGNQYDIFNAIYPYPEFNINNYYNVGDKVYWKGYTYRCAAETEPLTTEVIIQYPTYNSLPQMNVFPDSATNATGNYWNEKTPYSIHAYISSPMGQVPTDTDFWKLGDNRCQQLVMYITDIVVYHLHRSIAPMNIPELRKEAYKYAIKWLTDVAKGIVTPNIPQLQPTQGLKFRFGGPTKRNNHY